MDRWYRRADDGDAVQCHVALPLDAGMGQTSQSLVNAASDRMRSGLYPATMARVVAVTVPAQYMSSNSPARSSRIVRMRSPRDRSAV